MTDEERATELANMHRCIDASAKVWDVLARTAEETGMTEKSEVMGAIGLIFPTPLANSRQEIIMHQVADIVNRFDLTSCGLWEFAHTLMHVIYDEDMPSP